MTPWIYIGNMYKNLYAKSVKIFQPVMGKCMVLNKKQVPCSLCTFLVYRFYVLNHDWFVYSEQIESNDWQPAHF